MAFHSLGLLQYGHLVIPYDDQHIYYDFVLGSAPCQYPILDFLFVIRRAADRELAREEKSSRGGR